MLVRTAPALEEAATSEVATFEQFLNLRESWNALATSSHDEPFYRHEFLKAWLESFAPRAPLRIVTRHDSYGTLRAVLPLRAVRASLCGVPVRQLVTLSNTHSCRFDLLASDPRDDAEALLTHLLRKPGWDVLVLKDVPEGGHAHELMRAAAAAGLPTGVWESQRSPFILMPDSEEDFYTRVSSAFRRNLRRRRRRLEERGKVTFERLESGTDLEERLTSCLSVESGGWKGRRGTAINQDRRVRDFYARLAGSASAQGYFALYTLLLDDRIIAFQYGLCYGDSYYMPKLAYDESLSDCSPGMLLLQDVLRDCLQRGIARVDFLGDDMDWKRKWALEVTPHHWLYIFRDTRLGRALHRAKFRWIPSTRRFLADIADMIPRRRGGPPSPDS